MTDYPNLNHIGSSKRSKDPSYNEEYFGHGLQVIERYSISVEAERITSDLTSTAEVSKGYIVEVHEYLGFAMLKYFPRDAKKHPNKFSLRAEDLGFKLKLRGLRTLLMACTHLMKRYLDENKENFIGYVGQPDKKDDQSVNYPYTAKRARVYNRWVATMFQTHKYSLPDPTIFKEVNINLVRRAAKKDRQGLTPEQEENYERFLNTFKSCEGMIFEFMTERTRRRNQ